MRGLRTHASPRVAGRLAGSAMKMPTKTYNVAVERNGWPKKPKDMLRQSARPTPALEHEAAASDSDDGDVRALVMRQRRLSRFRVGCHFPTLVSPQLLKAPTTGSAAGPAVHHEPGEVFPKPARCAKTRKQTKLLLEGLPPWVATGSAGAEERICNRQPALGVSMAASEDPGALPPLHGAAPVQAAMPDDADPFTSSVGTSPSSASGAAKRIAAMRERGRAFNESLNDRYAVSRERFRAQRSQLKRQHGGALSTFEQTLEEDDGARVPDELGSSAAAGGGIAAAVVSGAAGGGGMRTGMSDICSDMNVLGRRTIHRRLSDRQPRGNRIQSR